MRFTWCSAAFLAVVLAAACASTPRTLTPQTVWLEKHAYSGAYVDNYRIGDKDVKKLYKAGVQPLFEVPETDLKALYPDYAPKADAPLVGILFNREGQDYALPASYVYGAVKAGARVRVLSFENLPAQVKGLDGIILTGGDFDWPTDMYARLQDKKYPAPGPRYGAYEYLTHYAAQNGVPLLGICAGMEAMGYILGEGRVKFYEDLSAVTPHSHRAVPALQTAHTLKPVPKSRFKRVVGPEEMQVNSRHFQGVIAASLAGAGTVQAAAFSPDGVVEALEFAAHPNFLAVQFHPEAMAWKGDERAQKIFDAFVRDAAAYKSAAAGR